jgi:hypothetical protein
MSLSSIVSEAEKKVYRQRVKDKSRNSWKEEEFDISEKVQGENVLDREKS